MYQWFIKKVLGSRNQRLVRQMMPLVEKINEIERGLQNLGEDDLRAKIEAWKEQFVPFHKPEFLAGYALTVAPRGEVLSALSTVGATFQKLGEHFSDVKSDPFKPEALSGLSDDELRSRMNAAREAYLDLIPRFKEVQDKILEKILPEVFACVKNAARRLCGRDVLVSGQTLRWDMVHFDVQLVGGIALHRGMIAEMATGEGKTLVATLPVVLNALTGRGVHLVTVNDYLAKRDSEWMGHLYSLLGLTTGVIQNDMDSGLRKRMYDCDVTYGTNSEFGFDYLRDNGMARSKAYQVQREHFFAIVDEVDSVLIDEARTPLIISGPVTVSTHQFDRYKPMIEQLVRKQNQLCAQLATDIRELLEKKDESTAGKKLYLLKLAQPKSRAFLRFMEDPALRRLLEKSEKDLYQDPQKKELFALKEGAFYTIEEKNHEADLTESGRNFLNPDDPDAFVLPDLATAFAEIDGDESLSTLERERKKEELETRLDTQGQRIHNIQQLLRAYCLYEKDVHYVIEENKVVIVDEQTGRKMPGRRWSDGLHQAVEAKEGVTIDKETQTLATITIQNYFRLYEKLAGMTGTAETDAAEFQDIYRLEVLPIPTNRPVRRIDGNDAIYKTRREKYNAVIEKIKERHAAGQPILVGTASVDASETMSRLLKREKISHTVLNAKFHSQEADIVARAGQRGAVTISTNMAGRGTDIKLAPEVLDLGGLFVIATERHESRRVDRQLRGRCARQGDPGLSRFYLSFEDDLMRNFAAAERLTKWMERFGMKEGEELEHPWLNKSVETAQKRVEQRNYMIRKRVLDYDDVMNQQREIMYEFRNEVLETPDPRVLLFEAIDRGVPDKVAEYVVQGAPDEEQNFDGLLQWLNTTFPVRLTKEQANWAGLSNLEISEKVVALVKNAYELKARHEDPARLPDLERDIMLSAIDRLWQEHLYAMDGLKEGVNLRSYGQKDPLVEYKQEAFATFQTLMSAVNLEVMQNLFRSATTLEAFELFLQSLAAPSAPSSGGGRASNPEPRVKLPEIKPEVPKAGRNDPCPCGSGKKFKNCCGRA